MAKEKGSKSHVDLASLSTGERNDFFIEIVVWWCGAVLFLLGAVICALLCILPIFLGQKITFFDAFFNDALPETAWRPVLAGLGFLFAYLLHVGCLVLHRVELKQGRMQ